MRINNIHNNKREVTMFCREQDGTLKITKDNSYFPYYYELSATGKFKTYDNQNVMKIITSSPSDIVKQRGPNSYEADVMFSKRYIIDKIPTFEKTTLKYIFLDIEVLATDMPDPMKAPYPISCITVYNSMSQSVHTWYMGDARYDIYPTNQTKELHLLADFVSYIKSEQPDLLLAWNMSFDYTYIHQRLKDFAKAISPIGEARYGNQDGIMYPAGISICDYMEMFKKVYMREQSYALDNVAQKYLGEAPWAKTAFNVLSDMMRLKNINDVKRMTTIEGKFQLLDYYDEIRRFATCTWEDLTANSRILDMVVLREASRKGVVLPNKKKKDENDTSTEPELQGAYRRAESGVYKNIYKADIVSMYPSQMVNFCLDAQNITAVPGPDTIEVDGIHVIQNENALLPTITKQLMLQKDALKKELKGASNEALQKSLQNKYNAIKGLVNSMYGVTAFAGFRLYNYDIASRITSLSRSLLMYVENKMREMSYEVIYTDTDALMYKAQQDEIVLLNKLVQDWAIETFNKPDINITFESEGMFTKLLIMTKCRYLGYTDTPKGRKTEIKGMEMKRSSSSKYESIFQRELVDLVLEEKTKEELRVWVEDKISNIQNEPLVNLAFPAKIANKEYKNKPIFVRAFENTQLFDASFKVAKGELFHYIFTKNYGKDAAKKDINVVILTDSIKDLKEHLDWDEIIRRNIMMKTDAIFEALFKETLRGNSSVECQVHTLEASGSIPLPATKKRGRPKKLVLEQKTDISILASVKVNDAILTIPQTLTPYFETNLGKCYNASCLDLLKSLETDSCQMMFTSPPYNTGNKGKNKDMYTEYKDNLSEDDYFNLLNTVIKEGMRVCKGPVFFNINYMTNNKKILYRILHENSDFLRENIIWKKDRVQPPIGNILGKRYEYIFVFTKDPKVEINNFRVNKASNYKAEFGNWISNLIEISLKTDQTKFAKTHRAGFPLDLPKMFIDIFTKEGDTIIDPFMGLGTTAMASELLKRRWIGSELVKKYCDIIKERLDESSVS